MNKFLKSLRGAVMKFDRIAEFDNNAMCPASSPLLGNNSHESEYDENNFLTVALGDELLQTNSSNEYIFPRSESIATDDISELLSSIDSIIPARRRRCRKGNSKKTISNTNYSKSSYLYIRAPEEAVANYKKSSTAETPKSYASYEDITNFYQTISTNKNKKLAKNKIFVHETIIGQAEKALDHGRSKHRAFVGSPAHLEAERTLLVSKLTRQAVINTLYAIQETTNETRGRVTIENLRCHLNTTSDNHRSLEQYYVCILQRKATVYSTIITTPNMLGWVDFGGCFIFDDVPNTFSIKIELYTLQLPQIPRNCLVLLRSSFNLPMMQLVGETQIGIMNRKSEKFSVRNPNGNRFGEHKLTASIHTSVKWPETLRGFLTIGIERQEHQPIWNRRWCVLEDGKLKYYNYPSDENYCKPVGTLFLETCKLCDESHKRYLRQKTLTLITDNDSEYKNYYLSPDTTEEFNLWRQNVEVVLRFMKEWNIF